MRIISMKMMRCFRTIQRMSCQNRFVVAGGIGETVQDWGDKTLEGFCAWTAWQLTECSLYFLKYNLNFVINCLFGCSGSCLRHAGSLVGACELLVVQHVRSSSLAWGKTRAPRIGSAGS